MKVGLYQSNPVFGEVEKNIEGVISALSNVVADLIVLPEFFNTGYQFVSKKEAAQLAEEIPQGRTCSSMISLARRKKVFLVFGLAEKNKERIFNSAVLVGPKGLIGLYRKTHLFAEEKELFCPGDTGFEVFDIGLARIGVMICFDWWFPESARVLALKGADIICHPANLVLPHCQDAMVTRSLENGIFSITANRVGSESRGGRKPLHFTGASQIVDNQGTILSRLEGHQTGVLLAYVDPGKAKNKRINEQNDRFMDRRPEFYESLIPR